MTTIAALVAASPDPTFGAPTGFALHGADTGEWRHVLELADPAAGSSVEWFDITEWFTGYEYTRGADSYLGRYRASIANLDLFAPDDRFAPWNEDTSDTFGVHVDLGPGLLVRSSFIRVAGGVVAEWNPRFTCKVEFWGDASYSQGKIRQHRIVARDTLTSLVGVPIPADTEENWTDRISSILTAAGWSYGHTIYGPTTIGGVGILPLPDRAEQASAINELDASTDPAGAVWFTNRKGQLIVRPSVYDTYLAGRFDPGGAAGTPYPEPDPVTFAWWACTGEEPPADYGDLDTTAVVAYALDTPGVEPFGLDRSETGIVNHVVITSPSGTFDDDDPASVQRYDRHTFQASWITANDFVAADILAARASATVEAKPITTTIALDGFQYGADTIDYTDDVEVWHRNGETGQEAHAAGWLRSYRELVRPLGCDTVWTMQVTLDVFETSARVFLLPVEGLTLTDVTDLAATFAWTNPTQVIEPTHTQVRMTGSVDWMTVGYPITGLTWSGLAPYTPYTFEVRLIRVDDTVVTNFSPTRSVVFMTADPTVPEVDVDTDEDEADVVFPPPGEGCDLEWELQALDTPPVGSGDELATGGTITYSDPYVIHTFTSGGTFTPSETLACDYVVVAGGGGGGAGTGGGGGAGGMVSGTTNISAAQTITVGTGGTAGTGGPTGSNGGDGGTSSIGALVSATGGGGGGKNAVNGRTGGSGGGGGADPTTGGAPVSGQGSTGGNGSTGGAHGCGGGGGKGAVGANGSSVSGGGAGGVGATVWAGTFAGGGGGGSLTNTTAASGGTGGGGTGGKGVPFVTATSGTANTGGGGGGQGANNTAAAGAGGSGIVKIRYTVVPDSEWTTVDSGTVDGPAPYALAYDTTSLDPDLFYRFRSREVCGGVPGDWINGDPLPLVGCLTVDRLGDAPYDDPDLVAYWPQVCADHVEEAVSDEPMGFGNAFDRVDFDDAGRPVMHTFSEGVIGYGTQPVTVPGSSDLTISARVRFGELPVGDVIVFGYGGLYLSVNASGSGWTVDGNVYEAGTGVISITSTTVQAVDTEYTLYLTHEVGGKLSLYVDDTLVKQSVADIDDRSNTLGLYSIGGPADSWVTDCAVWDIVLADIEPPGLTVTALGGNSRSGAASTTITLTGLSIPDGALVLVFAGSGQNVGNTISCACTGITFADVIRTSNTTPNPDRLSCVFRGIASGAGSTITVTFPASVGEAYIAACYLTGTTFTSNGADQIAQSKAHYNAQVTTSGSTPSFDSAANDAVVGYAMVFDSSGNGIAGTGATTVVDYSPGSTYSVFIGKFPDGTDSPVFTWNASNFAGEAMLVEFTEGWAP